MGTAVVLVLCKWLVLPSSILNKGVAVCKLLVHLAASRLLCASFSVILIYKILSIVVEHLCSN